MKNSSGDVLYVGKAKNLRQRVKQYFSRRGDGRFMVPFLISKVADIEIIVVNSEKEALLLENNLIKKYNPKYNVFFKDDKTYIALKMTTQHEWPMIQLVRYRGKPEPNGLYFGPYTSAQAARKTFDLLNRLFPLRQCSDQELARRTRPCILYEMKRCIAPCVQLCTKEEYQRYVSRTIDFLKGKDEDVLKALYLEMQTYADNLEFEEAADLHRTIKQIEQTIETQHVDSPVGGDLDIIGLFRKGDEAVLVKMIFRSGSLIGSQRENLSLVIQEDSEIIKTFLMQHYQGRSDIPGEILTTIAIPEKDALEEILSQEASRRVLLLFPQKGKKRVLIGMALKNAEALFHQEKDAREIRERTLLQMQEKFKLVNFPKKIECADISNISGSQNVASLVTFVDGMKNTSGYRKYKIKSFDGPNDYGAMKEVLSRRYRRAVEENNLPDLMIVDGGKGHLNVVIKVLEELSIATVDVISVAKEEGRHDKGMTHEQVFLRNVKDPIQLKVHSPILFLLQQIRDEAHRFAINFHIKSRSKQTITSALDEIVGIGPIKKKRLLKHFGSLKRIREATQEQLMQVEGITKRDLLAIRNFFT